MRPWFQAFFDGITIGKFEADIAVPPNRTLRTTPLATFEQPMIG